MGLQLKKRSDDVGVSARINSYTMRNSTGCSVQLTNLGARIMRVVVPDREGLLDDVALGFADAGEYLCDTCYLGATVGPVANRISDARFVLEGQIYELDRNDGPNTNHGGFHGLDKHVFDCLRADDRCVVFRTETADGEGGFPGGVRIEVAYTFDDNNLLRMDYFAVSARKTILNLTNHTYFNLSACRRSALASRLQICSSRIVASDAHYIPTGELTQTNGGRHDFAVAAPIGAGYNDYHILDTDNDLPAATLTDGESGRALDVYTSYPGVFFYSGDFLESCAVGLHGRRYAPFDGVCLEAQLYPNAVNRPGFPSVTLDPGAEYRHYIAYHFRTNTEKPIKLT